MTNKTCQCPHSPGWLRWFDHQELSSFYCQPSQDNASVILKLQKNPPITFFAPLFSLGPGWLRLLRAHHPSESQWARSDITSHMLCLERTAALQKYAAPLLRVLHDQWRVARPGSRHQSGHQQIARAERSWPPFPISRGCTNANCSGPELLHRPQNRKPWKVGCF